jgi:hypothetical protein
MGVIIIGLVGIICLGNLSITRLVGLANKFAQQVIVTIDIISLQWLLVDQQPD